MECKMILKSCAAKLAKETKVPAGENSELQSLSCSPKNFSAQPGLDWLCARAVDAKITWDGRRGQKDKVGLRKGLRGSMRDWVGGKSGKRQNCPRKRLDGSDAWLTWSQKVSDVAALHSVHSTSALLMNCSSSSPNCTMHNVHIALNTLHVTLNTALHEIGLYTFTSHRKMEKNTAHCFIDIRQETIFNQVPLRTMLLLKKQLAAAVLLLELDFNFV